MTREQACRRADWSPGRPFALPGDPEGSRWDLPLPTIDLSPIPQVDREDSQYFGRAWRQKQDGLQRWLDTVLAEDPTGVDVFTLARVVFPIAEELLTRNYNLTREELVGLLLIVPNDPRNNQLWAGLLRHALAIGPRTVERYHRLAFLFRAGASGGLQLQEDAQDLGAFLARPSMVVEHGQLIPIAPFPSRDDWVDDPRSSSSDDGEMPLGVSMPGGYFDSMLANPFAEHGQRQFSLSSIDRMRGDQAESFEIELCESAPGVSPERWKFPVPRDRFVFEDDTASSDGLRVVSSPGDRDDSRYFSAKFRASQAEFRQTVLDRFVAYFEDPDREYSEADEDDLHEGFARAAFPLAVDLIRRQYNLTDDEVCKLLQARIGNDANKRMWLKIGIVILANIPIPASKVANNE